MDYASYQRFTAELVTAVEALPEAVGLVALGSMAQRDYQPDEHSDHDFFLVVTEGAAEQRRHDLSWLPHPERVVLAFRETEHGLKVAYDDGHLLEFAVFAPSELTLAKVNRYRVLVDRADVGVRMLAVLTATPASLSGPDDVELGQLLTTVLVGVGRWARGERLSGRRFVHGHAVGHLLVLLARHVRPAGHGGLGGRDGTGTHGTRSDGIGRDGSESDGTGSDGTGSDGTGSDGTGSDGTGSDGPGSDGPGSDGTGGHGPGSDGLSGSSGDEGNGGKAGVSASLLDGLDPYRRFERVHPALGAEIDRALAWEPPQTALALLGIARRELAAAGLTLPMAAFDTVERRVQMLA